MRSPFLLLFVVSTSAALTCHLGFVDKHRDIQDVRPLKCGRKVTHCALDVDSTRRGKIGLRCGDADEICDEGCTEGVFNKEDIKCCCNGDLCNDYDLLNRHKIKKAPKIEEGGSCVVGNAPLQPKFSKPNLEVRSCPTTVCMKKLMERPRLHFALECGDVETCKDLPECNNSMAQDCCCVGKECNWKKAKTGSVPELPSIEDGHPEKPMIPIDTPPVSSKPSQFDSLTKYLQNPRELQGLIYAIYMWIIEMGKSLLQAFGIGTKVSE